MQIEDLNQPLSSLKNIGSFFSKALSALAGGNKVFHLLLHFPTRGEKIFFVKSSIAEIPNDSLIAIALKIVEHFKPKNARHPYKIKAQSLYKNHFERNDIINLVFFKIFPSQIEKLAINKQLLIVGRLNKSLFENQITHPQEILHIDQSNKILPTNLIYPLSSNITQRFLQNKINEVINNLPIFDEWIDSKFINLLKLPTFGNALKIMHNPNIEIGSSLNNLAKKRLAFDELLAFQLAVLLLKNINQKTKIILQIKENFADEFLSTLPFKPTESQIEAALQIKKDILSNKRMSRLLQGDVGSGKTILAIYSCLLANSCGKQACVIVPISILANQHFLYFNNFLRNFSINIEILTSKTTKKNREKILQDLQNGKINILIGTHAILQDDVIFKNLGVAIIDEQHRFGVMQRLKLVEKNQDVDVLSMSATPIPRSLMMTIYGDMDISILNQKPIGRKEIKTLIMSQQKDEEIFLFVKRALEKQEKIYWICPMIEENEESYLTSAETRFSQLQKIFGTQIALIHGKMKESEKEKIMENFANNSEIKILVATTVIEVGVDIKEATIIVIDNAENFGLSQLHQIRGRVGRSNLQSYCILLYGKKYGANGKKRLAIIRDNNDGFFIAEEDLKLRGSGELVGTKQSGIPEFKIANLSLDYNLLQYATQNAQIILDKDLKLEKTESKKYKQFLTLFGYEKCFGII